MIFRVGNRPDFSRIFPIDIIPRTSFPVKGRSGLSRRRLRTAVFRQATFFRLIALDFMNMLYSAYQKTG